MGGEHRESYRELFKELKILPLSPQLIFCSLFFVVNKGDYLVSNSVYHNINTRQRNDLHLPLSGHVSEGSLLFRHQNL